MASFVLPAAEKDLCLSAIMDMSKGWMSKWAFFGMMFGSLVWGPISDSMGRRNTLMTCLSLSVLRVESKF